MNMIWVFGYNVVVILIVVVGLFNFLIVGVVMVFLLFFVVLNSLWLCNFGV